MNQTDTQNRIAVLCRIRDMQRSIAEFEKQFEKCYGIGLNEGMALCSLTKAERLTSGELGELLGLTPSHTSKVLASIERKGLVERTLGKEDKRQMYFSLTTAGQTLIGTIQCNEVSCPQTLASWLQ